VIARPLRAPTATGDKNRGTVQLAAGGVGRNIAQAIAQLGTAGVRLVTVVSADPLGHFVLARTRARARRRRQRLGAARGGRRAHRRLQRHARRQRRAQRRRLRHGRVRRAHAGARAAAPRAERRRHQARRARRQRAAGHDCRRLQALRRAQGARLVRRHLGHQVRQGGAGAQLDRIPLHQRRRAARHHRSRRRERRRRCRADGPAAPTQRPTWRCAPPSCCSAPQSARW
jgi:hypothetical protein